MLKKPSCLIQMAFLFLSKHLLTMILNYTPQEALEKSKQGTPFIDVREPFETAELSYDTPTLQLLPLSEFQEGYTKLDRNQEIIIACKSGGRSMQACTFLESQGFTNLINVDGGIMRWKLEGLPIK